MELLAGVEEFSLTFNPSTEVDVVTGGGYEVFAVPQDQLVDGDFVPSSSNRVYKGPNTHITIPAAAGIWGVKVAAYDVFGDSGLNYTPLMTCTVIATIDDLLEILSGQIGASQLNQDLNQTLAQVGDLTTAYGDTVSAASSAAAAIAAKAAALQAQGGAEAAAATAGNYAVAAASSSDTSASYRTAAESAAASSTTAKNAALAARDAASGYASSASTHADTATAKATEAGNSAAAAQTSATTAQTQAGSAQTYASQAASSSNTAQTAASNAGTYANNAQGYAATATSAVSTVNSALGIITAQYTIKVDANGRIAGIGFWSDSVTSAVEILADKFSIVESGPGKVPIVPFIVQDGTVYMAKAMIKEADVDTLKIANNAVTVPLYFETASTVHPDLSVDRDLISFVLDQSYPKVVTVNVTFTFPTSAQPYSIEGSVILWRGSGAAWGNPEGIFQFETHSSQAAGANHVVYQVLVPAAGEGTATYTFKGSAVCPANPGLLAQCQYAKVTVSVLGVKR
jgi:multidrug efflux pump subunit AcrA (membrane-fusion protein)